MNSVESIENLVANVSETIQYDSIEQKSLKYFYTVKRKRAIKIPIKIQSERRICLHLKL